MKKVLLSSVAALAVFASAAPAFAADPTGRPVYKTEKGGDTPTLSELKGKAIFLKLVKKLQKQLHLQLQKNTQVLLKLTHLSAKVLQLIKKVMFLLQTTMETNMLIHLKN